MNVTLGHWPLRRLPLDDAAALKSRLRQLGVFQAWAGSFEALLHKDLGGVNARLARECRRHGPDFFLPFGCVDPSQPDWEEELRRCAEDHRMPGIRLHPNYHGYRLEDPPCRQLFHAAARRDLLVQVALVMEDERMMHPRLRVDPVEPGPLLSLARELPSLRLLVLNGLRTVRAKPLLELVATDRVYFEISHLEGVGGVANLLQQIPPSRLLFGSHAPLFYPEAASLKLQESPLSPEAVEALSHHNARQLLHPSPRHIHRQSAPP